MELFPKNDVVGIFRGFTEGGLEFHADIVLPYKADFHSLPMHGTFVLVQLENPDEAVLGRIASFTSEGRLSYGAGEEFNIRAVEEDRDIPDDLRVQYLRYRVNIRVLGVLRLKRNGPGGKPKPEFVASHRRLPHVGSRVAFPNDEVLQHIVGHHDEGAVIGHFALGEYVYCNANHSLKLDEWVQAKDPEVQVHFNIGSLVSRRTFCFARAGFGKSNLTKLLFATLYQETPTVTKRNDRKVPVGTVIFDPDGEYFWPDDKGRPGLADVRHLEDKLVVFTNRRAPSDFYQSFVAAGVKIDIRRLPPADVIGLALSPERQEQQNVRKLKGMSGSNWQQLVDLIHKDRNRADLDEIAKLLHLEQEKGKVNVEANAARSNMTSIVSQLHDPNSRMMDHLKAALRAGKLCVVDLSQMRGSQGMILSGLVLRRIFEHNQNEFTQQTPKTIPTVAVIEEAQSVLVESGTTTEPFISWVKEGRKYDLGAMLITQQPGSIPTEILSQGDNWFIFHLLSAVDLQTLKRANAHFSDDLLSSLLNEPLPGHGLMWSSVEGKPYPRSLRVSLFEEQYPVDANRNGSASPNTWASNNAGKPLTADQQEPEPNPHDGSIEGAEQPSDSSDYLSDINSDVLEKFQADENLRRQVESEEGMAWKELAWALERMLPDDFEDANTHAFKVLVRFVLDETYGPEKEAWESYRNDNAKPNKDGSAPVFARAIGTR